MDTTKIKEIISEVHSASKFDRYEEINVRNNTNCYSHALGATSPYIELYRIGALSQKKPIEEEYESAKEIEELLFEDCKAINLKIKKSSLEELPSEGEYKIILFVKIFANGLISDYHFWRTDDNITWHEKWRGRYMHQIENFKRDFLDYFPWNFMGVYKVSRK